MNKIVLLLGGNLGDKYVIMSKAQELLCERLGSLDISSSYFETEAWGFDSDNIFLNKVLVMRTSNNALDSLRICQDIEIELGRVRKENRYSSRFIDIDVLFFNDEIINITDLIVPHPRIQERRFVLEPLNEVMCNYIHPLLQKKISTLLEECADNCMVKKVD